MEKDIKSLKYLPVLQDFMKGVLFIENDDKSIGIKRLWIILMLLIKMW